MLFRIQRCCLAAHFMISIFAHCFTNGFVRSGSLGFCCHPHSGRHYTTIVLHILYLISSVLCINGAREESILLSPNSITDRYNPSVCSLSRAVITIRAEHPSSFFPLARSLLVARQNGVSPPRMTLTFLLHLVHIFQGNFCIFHYHLIFLTLSMILTPRIRFHILVLEPKRLALFAQLLHVYSFYFSVLMKKKEEISKYGNTAYRHSLSAENYLCRLTLAC